MKRKLDILLMVMFLFGSMIFLCPIFGQIKEVEEDDRVYTRMSAQVKPLQQASGLVEDAPSPAAAAVQTVLPLLLEVPQAEKTAVPAAAPPSAGQSRILCKLQNVVQIEQNLCKTGAAQAAAALFIK